MKTKKCTKCNEFKPTKEFNKHDKTKDKLNNKCKSCVSRYNKAKRRTKLGVVMAIYNAQKRSSKIRKHPLPTYSFDALYLWLFWHDSFHLMYDSWAKSGYKSKLKPSVDRFRDYEGYYIGNIKVIEWGKNRDKSYLRRRSGQDSLTKKVVAKCMATGKKSYFVSMAKANEKTKVPISNISRCCNGKQEYGGGYRWFLG